MKHYIRIFSLFIALASLPLNASAEDKPSDRFAGAMPGQYLMPATPDVNVYGFGHDVNPRALYRPPAFRGGMAATSDSSVILYPLEPGQPVAMPYQARPVPVPQPQLAQPRTVPQPVYGMPSPTTQPEEFGAPINEMPEVDFAGDVGPMESYVRRYYGLEEQDAAEAKAAAEGYETMPAAPTGAVSRRNTLPKPQSIAPSGHAPGKILFDHGSAALDSQDIGVIRRVAKRYALQPRGTRYIVHGHASRRAEASDPRGKHIANLKMSSHRAFQVSRRLILEGVPSQAIETIAYGDTHPVPPASGRSSEELSRRVEIYVESYR